MNTFKITTTTGYETYLSNSQTPEAFKKDNMGFDYDKFNNMKVNKPDWDKSSGVINEIEFFYCGETDKQVKVKL